MQEWLWLRCPSWFLRFKLVRRMLGVLDSKEIDKMFS